MDEAYGSPSRRQSSVERFRFPTTSKLTSSPPVTRKLSIVKKDSHELDDRRSFICAKCNEKLIDPRILSCLHSFCTKCLLFLAQQMSAEAKSDSQSSSRRESLFKAEEYSKFEPNIISTYDAELGYSTEALNVPSSPPPQSKIKKSQITSIVIYCCICGTGTSILNGDVYQLPLNYALQSRMLMSRTSIPVCDLCTLESLAVTKCVDCEIFMCSACTDTHRTFWENELHSLVPVKDSLKAPMRKVPALCEFHSGLLLDQFCQTCCTLVCAECCTMMHGGHKIDNTSVAARRYSTALVQILEKTQPCSKDTLRALEVTRQQESKIKEKCREVENEVEFHIQSYHDALEDHRQSLLKEIAQVKEDKLESINEQIALLEKKIKHTEFAMASADELLRDSSEAELLSIASVILERLDWCLAPSETLHVNVSNMIQFLPHERSTSNKIHQLYGVITTQSISPIHCHLQNEGLLNCRQHKRANVTLVTRDSDSQMICHGGEKINVELRYRDSTQRLLPVSVTDEGDGTYTISFTPDSPGTLALSVMIHDEHILGSPYKVSVFTFRPHSGTFHCCSFCSSGGSKSAVCGCGGKMPGGYNGCGHGHSGHPGRRHWSCCGNVLQNSECSRPVAYQFSL